MTTASEPIEKQLYDTWQGAVGGKLTDGELVVKLKPWKDLSIQEQEAWHAVLAKVLALLRD